MTHDSTGRWIASIFFLKIRLNIREDADNKINRREILGVHTHYIQLFSLIKSNNRNYRHTKSLDLSFERPSYNDWTESIYAFCLLFTSFFDLTAMECFYLSGDSNRMAESLLISLWFASRTAAMWMAPHEIRALSIARQNSIAYSQMYAFTAEKEWNWTFQVPG